MTRFSFFCSSNMKMGVKKNKKFWKIYTSSNYTWGIISKHCKEKKKKILVFFPPIIAVEKKCTKVYMPE